MPIPESQLETWSNPGAVTTSKSTHESIRTALTAATSPIRQLISDGNVEIYLQGSYKNDTNIRGDSDVDVVVELKATFYSNLAEPEKQALGFILATYQLNQFRADVIQALTSYYGQQFVDSSGNKSVKLKSSGNRLGADVVPCALYRTYRSANIIAEGITFWTQYDNRQIINFPKLHYQNGVIKNSAQITNGWYKPTVRIFKNARSYMVDKSIISADLAPSYFLESLIYNAPVSTFGTSYQDTVIAVSNWLWKAQVPTLFCQNGQIQLFGTLPEQWDSFRANQFLTALKNLWNNWNQ